MFDFIVNVHVPPMNGLVVAFLRFVMCIFLNLSALLMFCYIGELSCCMQHLHHYFFSVITGIGCLQGIDMDQHDNMDLSLDLFWQVHSKPCVNM